MHGDDFTALGLDDDLDWYETEFAKHFELKIRGRIGEGCGGENEIRILNRIVRLTPEGLTYEADPRHVDILAASLGLAAANAVTTPGVKSTEADYTAQKANESSEPPMLDHEGGMRVAALSDKHCKKVLFTGSLHSMTTFHDVPAHSDIYGCHPAELQQPLMVGSLCPHVLTRTELNLVMSCVHGRRSETLTLTLTTYTNTDRW